jgi:hypothetical protein
MEQTGLRQEQVNRQTNSVIRRPGEPHLEQPLTEYQNENGNEQTQRTEKLCIQIKKDGREDDSLEI